MKRTTCGTNKIHLNIKKLSIMILNKLSLDTLFGVKPRTWKHVSIINAKSVVATLAFLSAFATSTFARQSDTPLTLWYTKPATVWMTSALPIGNGEMGAMFFGGVEKERIQFNEKSLWTGSPTIRGAYQNFGELLIDFGENGEYSDYRRQLSLDEAVGTVSYKMNGVSYKREYFASYPHNAIVIHLTTPKAKGKLSFFLDLKDAHGNATTANEGCMTIKGAFETICYEAQAVVKTIGGSVSTDKESVAVSNADEATIILTCATNYDQTSPSYTKGNAESIHQSVTSTLQTASNTEYKKLLAEHVKDYKALFNRVRLELNATQPEYPTNELAQSHKDNNYMDMLYFQYGRYLMISSSRGNGLPSNLQGLWNNTNTPPWECDYHSNINIQMNYWPAEVANLSECHSRLFDYVSAEALKTNGSWQNIAKEENCRGWAVDTQNNPFGYSDWNINRPANAWYCTHFWQHYQYSLDKQFLSQTAWPIMKLTCQYWFDRLVEKDGKLVAPNDWSPEHGPWTDGPAYAQQLVAQLFDETLSAAKVLNINDDFTQELQDKANRVDRGLHIGSWGQLKEWMSIEDEKGDEHRHLSHLIALYPGHAISYIDNKDLAEAARVTLDSRGDFSTGWSRAWKVACRARLCDAERAYKMLKQAQNLTTAESVSMNAGDGGLYENLFCAHPPFQIDGNFGATAGIAEMLIQNTSHGIQVLPALPKAWSTGSFHGLRAMNDFTLDAEWSNGKVQTINIHSESGATCRLYMPTNKPLSITTSKGKSIETSDNGDQSISFNTQKGQSYIVKFSE